MDGWTESTTHFVAVFATYMKEKCYYETLLAIGPLLDEEKLSASEHEAFIEATLELYNKSTENVVAIIGDNCSTNKKLARNLLKPLVGCNSHKFNLAVKRYIQTKPEFSKPLDKVKRLMTELRKLKLAGKLRKVTNLRPVKPNETRWSGLFMMLTRFFEFEECTRSFEEIEGLLPFTKEKNASQMSRSL